MGNCANKPVTKDGEAPPPAEEEVAVESREIVAGEVETKTEGEKVGTEEATTTSTEPPEEVTPVPSKVEETTEAPKEAEPEKAAA